MKRHWLLLAAALVVVALIVYPSSQCKVTGSELKVSPLKTFVIDVQAGYAVGFSFNVTNGAGCDINARDIHVLLRSTTYADGREIAQNSDDTDPVSSVLSPGQTGTFSYTLNSYLEYRPTKLNLRVEITFAETGPVPVFDGELAFLG
jgi:hypothetical protein